MVSPNSRSNSFMASDWVRATQDMKIEAYNPILVGHETSHTTNNTVFTRPEFEADLRKVSSRLPTSKSAAGTK